MYFSNGTENEIFQSKFCENCVNFHNRYPCYPKDTVGCPIMDVHFLYNGDDAQEGLLNVLINKKHGCLMFKQKKQAKEQLQFNY